MSYCTVSDITANVSGKQLSQITNDFGGDTVDETKITAAIDYTNNIIDGYLRGRYNLPLTSTPNALKYLAIDFVVYRLYSRRDYTNVPENIKEKYKEVVKRLYEIQNGKFSLGIESTNEYSDLLLKTNKTGLESATNKFYTEDKWDEYDAMG
jgi:phage gp36-like protein